MTEEQKKLRIQKEYDKINGEQCQNDCQILYNLICMKVFFGLDNYSRPLYRREIFHQELYQNC